jgi:hypothetical protein
MTPRAGLLLTLQGLRRSDQLQEFHRAYKLRRAAATARGEGFMEFGVAMGRLKAALIPMLIGNKTAPMRPIFEQIFSVIGATLVSPRKTWGTTPRFSCAGGPSAPPCGPPVGLICFTGATHEKAEPSLQR